MVHNTEQVHRRALTRMPAGSRLTSTPYLDFELGLSVGTHRYEFYIRIQSDQRIYEINISRQNDKACDCNDCQALTICNETSPSAEARPARL